MSISPIVAADDADLGPLAEAANENEVGAWTGSILSVPAAIAAHNKIGETGDRIAERTDSVAKAAAIGFTTGAAQAIATTAIVTGGTLLGAFVEDQWRANH